MRKSRKDANMQVSKSDPQTFVRHNLIRVSLTSDNALMAMKVTEPSGELKDESVVRDPTARAKVYFPEPGGGSGRRVEGASRTPQPGSGQIEAEVWSRSYEARQVLKRPERDST